MARREDDQRHIAEVPRDGPFLQAVFRGRVSDGQGGLHLQKLRLGAERAREPVHIGRLFG